MNNRNQEDAIFYLCGLCDLDDALDQLQFCRQCDLWICAICARGHSRMQATKHHILTSNIDVFMETRVHTKKRMKLLQERYDQLCGKIAQSKENVLIVYQRCDEKLTEIAAASKRAHEQIELEEKRLVATAIEERIENIAKISAAIYHYEALSDKIMMLTGEIEKTEEDKDGHKCQDVEREICEVLNELKIKEAEFKEVFEKEKKEQVVFEQDGISALHVHQNERLGKTYNKSDFKVNIKIAGSDIVIQHSKMTVSEIKTMVGITTGISKGEINLMCQENYLPDKKAIDEVVKGEGEEIKVVCSQWVQAVLHAYPAQNGSSKLIVGAPEVYPETRCSGVWTSVRWTCAYIDLKFPRPVVPKAVWIYETYNPGCLKEIMFKQEDNETWISVWNASGYQIETDTTRIFRPQLQCEKIVSMTDQVRLRFMSQKSSIDAVKLIGFL